MRIVKDGIIQSAPAQTEPSKPMISRVLIFSALALAFIWSAFVASNRELTSLESVLRSAGWSE
jgi:RsiW-degrading membrane proteinase PrsW (M82 family)